MKRYVSIFAVDFQGPYENNKKGKVKFMFNPYPLLAKGKGQYLSGYFTEVDLPRIIAAYGKGILKKVKYSWTIKENGLYPAFHLNSDGQTLADYLTEKGVCY